ncbi:MAG: adenylosuccinate lyase [Chloroflexota bacterium]|nr:adenylosuccinate lyase [Chloroflexota bacterium]
MNIHFTHETYLSPFTWRYGSEEMRHIWSEEHKRRLWRRIWVALARAQSEVGLVTPEQVADLEAHRDEVDIAHAHRIEAQIHHDLMAEVRTFAQQCALGGPIIHLGATSMDVEDNADVLRQRESLHLIRDRIVELLVAFADQIERWADVPTMGFTHILPAEPTTVGYRLCQYAQDLLLDLRGIEWLIGSIRGKGLKGAVGSSASYAQLLAGTGWAPRDLEARVMAELGLEPFPVATQTYPRKQDLYAVNHLASLAQSLHKFAFDLRVLHSSPIGEWSEPFGKRQVGSSAMPFKRNPILTENVCSLARYVASLPSVAWHNAANSLLERTLDDSANRRVVLAEGFLAADEMLRKALRIVRGLVVREEVVARNLKAYGAFAATERLLMELVKAGANRQAMHEVIREHSMAAWDAVQRGEPNPLAESLADDEQVLAFLPSDHVRELLDAGGYVGDAPQRCAEFLKRLRAVILTDEGGCAEARC